LVRKPDAAFINDGVHAAAFVVPHHHHASDLQLVHGELHDRQAIQVCVHHEIGHIAMHEDLTWRQADDLVGGHAAVRTADPQITGLLQLCEPLEVLRIFGDHVVRPGAVLSSSVFTSSMVAASCDRSQESCAKARGQSAQDPKLRRP